MDKQIDLSHVSDLHQKALADTSVALKSIISFLHSTGGNKELVLGELLDARKMCEWSLIDLAILASNDDINQTRSILASLGFPDIL